MQQQRALYVHTMSIYLSMIKLVPLASELNPCTLAEK